jgi:hypothetical protein
MFEHDMCENLCDPYSLLLSELLDIDVALYYDIADERKMYDLLFLISGSVPDKYDICMFQLLPLYVRIEVFKGKLIYADDK